MTDNFIRIELFGIPEIQEALADLPREVAQSIKLKMLDLAVEMRDVISNEKLNGVVLNRDTGALSDSVHFDVIDEGDSVTATMVAGGPSAPYAAIHEYGGVIQIGQVPHPITAQGALAGFTNSRQSVMPERSYMRSTLTDMAAHIKQELLVTYFHSFLQHFRPGGTSQ